MPISAVSEWRMSDDHDGCEWVSFFWYRPTRVVLDQRPLNGCVRVRQCSGAWPVKLEWVITTGQRPADRVKCPYQLSVSEWDVWKVTTDLQLFVDAFALLGGRQSIFLRTSRKLINLQLMSCSTCTSTDRSEHPSFSNQPVNSLSRQTTVSQSPSLVWAANLPTSDSRAEPNTPASKVYHSWRNFTDRYGTV